MTTAEILELEINLLEKQKQAIESDIRYKKKQLNDSMPTEEGMEDSDVAQLKIAELERDRDRLEAEIAEKKLALHDLKNQA